MIHACSFVSLAFLTASNIFLFYSVFVAVVGNQIVVTITDTFYSLVYISVMINSDLSLQTLSKIERTGGNGMVCIEYFLIYL